MKKSHLKFLLTITLLIFYNILFWKEKFGINLPVFTLLLASVIGFSRKQSMLNSMWWFSAVFVLITGFAVIYHNSFLAKFTHIISFLLLIAYSWSTVLKSPLVAIFNSFAAYINEACDGIKSIELNLTKTRSGRIGLYFAKLLLIPGMIIFVYILLYSGSNISFANFFSEIGDFIVRVFSSFFENLNFSRIIFILFGLLVVAVSLRSNPGNKIIGLLNDGLDDLFRKKKSINSNSQSGYTNVKYRKPFAINAIRKENYSGIFLLGSVNLLLLIFNITDIKSNWFGFEVPENFNLKLFVHQATWYLVISILLSIAIVLYLFRNSLNFYSKNNTIKILAKAWIIQNIILCISVMIRNMNYISYHGLAYKRIGVIAFLILTAIGLITMFYKIRKIKSAAWLLKTNSFALVTMLVLLSSVNWDMIIVKYNLNHKNISEIDISFYLQLSPQVYPVLYQNLTTIENQINAHQSKPTRWTSVSSYKQFTSILDLRAKNFAIRHNKYSWPSYNIADNRAFNQLKLNRPEMVMLQTNVNENK